jgi:PKD repeat protein
MKRNILTIGFNLLFGICSFSQIAISKNDISVSTKVQTNIDRFSKTIPTHFIPAPNMQDIQAEDVIRDKKGMLYRIGVASYTNLSESNSGVWNTLDNGDKVWQLGIKNPGAEALSFIFNDFKLSPGSSFWVQNKQGDKVSKVITEKDQLEDFQQHIALCFGDELTLVLLDKFGQQSSKFFLNRVVYNYRSTGNNNGPQKLNDSGSCNVNVNCPEGTNYQDEKRGIARILVVDGNTQGWCSGTLINNTSQNCKPLFLTALHCGPTVTTADFNLWKFYFRYEAPSCSNPTSEGTLANNFITGCFKLASSNDNVSGAITKSDFLLVQLGTLANEATTITTLKSSAFSAYWNGWDANNTASTSGVGIHHPAGDFKKISTYSASLVSSSYSNTANTHWQANWVQTTTNYGITEGGSSGSPLFTYNNGSSRVVGTLSGGASSCTATQGNKNDLYGKMSYHWTTYGTTSAVSLKYHLDPNNTGLLVLDGSSNPCSAPTIPVANFTADNTAPCIGSTVNFSDLSSGVPTSWAWTFNPNTITYTGGTLSTSQNPKVQFNASGPYTVTLVSTNGVGNDSEIKTAYISTSASTGSSLPIVENFESSTFPPTGWTISNPDGGSIVWATDGLKGFERRPAPFNTGSTAGAAAINCFNYDDASSSSLDGLVVKPINLTGATSPKMTFKRAYRYYNNPANYDELRVYVSTNCGSSYGTAIYSKVGVQLATNGALSTIFTPTATSEWDTDTIDLTAYIGQIVLIKFEVTNKYGNNIYLDDINISNLTVSASVAITSSDANNTICAGSSVTFTANPTNGGTTPSYQWKLNGSNVGTNSSTFTTSSLTNGQTVSCVMTSNLPGVTNSPATSNSIVTTVNSIPSTPTISQTGSQLTSSSVTGNQWYLNGNIISGATSQTYNVLQTGNYTVVVTSNGCNSSASAISNVDVTGVNEVNVESSTISIYPNPNNGQFTLTFSTVELMNYTIKFHDANGKLVFENELKNFTGNYSKEVDFTKNGKGEYFLSITNSKNQKIEKVIVY